MIMGNKIVKVEDSLLSIGGYILSALKQKDMSVDVLYKEFLALYPKVVSFDNFIYAIDFLFMIKKIRIEKDDILGAI